MSTMSGVATNNNFILSLWFDQTEDLTHNRYL
jgi:hypothetical protein